MPRRAGFWSVEDRLGELSAQGDPLEKLLEIVDTSLAAAPRQPNTDAEKTAIKAGKKAAEICPDKPAKAARKDTDARWTVKASKGKVEANGTIERDLAIPAFGYKSHISIHKRHDFIRWQKVTTAAAHDGARLGEGLVDPTNTASDVWADTAYRSKANDDFLSDRGKTSRIHRRKPVSKPMPKRTTKANARKSAIRATVQHVFAQQKDRMKLTIRSIGIKRAEPTIILANIANNLGRWRWWQGQTVSHPHRSTTSYPNRAINARPRSKDGNQPVLGGLQSSRGRIKPTFPQRKALVTVPEGLHRCNILNKIRNYLGAQ